MTQDSRELTTAVIFNRAASVVRDYLSSIERRAFFPRSTLVSPNNLRQQVALRSPELFRAVIAQLELNPVPQQLLEDIAQLETCARNVNLFYEAAVGLLERTDSLIYASQLIETVPANSYLRAELKSLVLDFSYDLHALLYTDNGVPSTELLDRLRLITSKLRDLQLPETGTANYRRYVSGYHEAELKLEVELLLVTL